MSTDYGYHCKTCPSRAGDSEDDVTLPRSNDFGRSPEILYSLMQCVDEIKALADKIREKPCGGWLEIKWLGHDWYPGPHDWLLAHYGHDIEVMDEYGCVVPYGDNG